MVTADSLNRKGIELQVSGDVEGARLHFLGALEVDPMFLPPLSNLAVIMAGERQFDAAIAALRRVVSHVPQDGLQWDKLGNTLMRAERLGEAHHACQRARELRPDHPAVWHNSALLEYVSQNPTQAIAFLERVEALGGASPKVTNDKAHMLLAQGDLGAGLAAYEARWSTLMHLRPWDFHLPEWQGEPLMGKRVLLHSEQGFGDTIMCARFAQTLAARGAEVVLGLPPGLLRLFAAQPWCAGVLDHDAMTEEDARGFDFHSPMYGAMRHLGFTAPYQISPDPYLTVNATPREDRHFNVGICWASGKRNNEMDWRRRVSRLGDWLQLAEVPGVRLWSLQKGDESAEISAIGAEALVGDHTGNFGDWLDTARFIAGLDLVITVDTAVAHLAGALGRPVWMLTQFVPCWRWWSLREGSGWPWYDSMSIVPQHDAGAWRDQLAECARRLTKSVQSEAALAA